MLRVESVSASVTELLHRSPGQIVGRPLADLLHPEDVPDLYAWVAEVRARGASVGATPRLRHGSDGWLRVRVLIDLLDPERRVAFALSLPHVDEPGLRERVADLEQKLWRIAREVEASGVAMGSRRTPSERAELGLDELSTRQWEVLRHLLRGRRVRSIADELCLSPSTVRNHLSAVFGKVGVSSQEELLDLLRPADDAS